MYGPNNPLRVLILSVFFALTSVAANAEVATSTTGVTRPCRRQGSRLLCVENELRAPMRRKPKKRSGKKTALRTSKTSTAALTVSPSLESEKKRSYAWYLVITDPIALGVTVLGMLLDSGDPMILSPLGLGAYVLVGPIVHAVNGHWGRGAVSLGMRTGSLVILPLVGFGIAHNLSLPVDGGIIWQGTAVVTALALVACTAIDILWLGKEDPGDVAAGSTALAPFVDVRGDRKVAGLALQF